MSEIIEQWLGQRVGLYVKLDSDAIGEIFYDGIIFAKLLVSFNIFNSKYLDDFCKPSHASGALKNLRKLCVWLKLLGVSHGETFLKEIASKKKSTCVRLLYELFVALENKEHMYFINEKKAKRLLTESSGRFSVEKATEPELEKQYSDENEELELLDSKKNILDRYQDNQQKFIEKCLADSMRRRKAIGKLSEKKKEIKLISPDFGAISCQPCDVDVMEEIKKFEESLKSPERLENNQDVINCSPSEYISLLKIRRRKAEADKYLKNNMEKAVLCDAWKDILKDQETEFHDAFSKKLLKQSDYEKRMTLRLSRVHLLYKKFGENRRMVLDSADKDDSLDLSQLSKTEQSNDQYEKAKVLELHKKLFNEKLEMSHKKNYDTCWIILEDLVDMAMLMSDFERVLKIKVTHNLPKYKEWKVLFLKGIRLLDHYPIPESEKGSSVVEKEEEFEDIIALDSEKMNVIAEHEFDMWLHLRGDWYVNQLLEVPPEFEDYFSHLPRWKDYVVMPYEEDLNMVGYIIHRLLDLKYPYCVIGKPADLQDYKVKVLMGPISDSGAISKLKVLLEKPNIALIEISSAINYVIGIYKEVTNIPEVKETIRKKALKDLKSSDGGSTGGGVTVMRENTKEERKASLKARLFPGTSPERGTKDVGVQMPSDTSLIDVTGAAEAIYLGGCAYTMLTEGKKLPDTLICKIIIEYIRSLTRINGWVLLNYPEDLTQVALLEYMFSGIEVPFIETITSNISNYIKEEMKKTGYVIETPTPEISINDYFNEDDINEAENIPSKVKPIYSVPHRSNALESSFDKEQYLPIAKLKELKNSILLPRPVPECPPPLFKSYFSKIIEIIQGTKTNANLTGKAFGKGKSKTNPPIKNPVEEEGEEVPELTLQNFYKSHGIHTTYHFRTLDTSAIKILARSILNEIETDDLSRKDSVVLFGLDALEAVDRSRKRTTTLKTRSSRTSTTIKLSITESAKNIFPEGDALKESYCELREPVEEEIEEEEIEDFLKKTYPGFRNWRYTTLPIEKAFQAPLASVWEAVEFFYIYNMKEVLTLIRSIECKVMPYRNYIRKRMEECITLPDERGSVTTSFQIMLNSIDNDLRPLQSMKRELHCRVFELQNKLDEMCSKKKEIAENMREDLIGQNWLGDQLINLIHAYRCMVQIETDRFIDTMQIIQDYHFLCISKMPSEYRLSKIHVPGIIWGTENGSELRAISRKSQDPENVKGSISSESGEKRESDIRKGMKIMITEKRYEASISELLHTPSLEQDMEFAAHHIWYTIIQSVFRDIDSIKEICLEEMSEHAEARKKKLKKEVKFKQKLKRYSKEIEEEETETLEMNNLLLEWEEALTEEHERAEGRLHLILAVINYLLRSQLGIVHSAFSEFQHDIERQYEREMTNISKLCDLLRTAIEEESLIQPLLVLEQDEFYADPNVVLYPEIPPPPPTAIKEHPSSFRFTISQLTNFYNKMIYVAPEGIIEQPFIQILEDMAYMGHEDGHLYLPRAWSDLSLDDIKYIVDSVFGNKTIIDWRDFIIYGLEIEFPTLIEILRMREDFRKFDPDLNEVVTYEQYACVVLWFETFIERISCENLRLAKIKDLLFKMYRISENEVNYTALLLAFCKDTDPRDGFAKALALVDGFGYIIRKEDMHLAKHEDEGESNEALTVAHEIVVDLLHRAFHCADDVVISDYHDEKDVQNRFIDTTQDQFEVNQMMLNLGLWKAPSRVDATTVKKKTEEEVEQGVESDEESEHDPRYVDFPWQAYVHHDTVMSLLVAGLHFYALSTDHILEQADLEVNLRNIFEEKGTNNKMLLYVLMETPYMNSFFKVYHSFQANNLSHLVAALFESKGVKFPFNE